MHHFSYRKSTYQVDEQGFLLNEKFWDTNFAEGVAKESGINGLTSEHWDAITYLRELFAESGRCPTIFAVCKGTGLRPREMKQLFPQGFHRGLCRMAGVHYRTYRLPNNGHLREMQEDLEAISGDKHYQVDARGFLVDPVAWDEHYALHRALDMRIPQGQLSDDHWRVIHFLRAYFWETTRIPTIYETCDRCHLDLEQMEALFPDGYHRGAVKIAGLRFVK
nr:TusE/DsrC/DsvC family sulfur relay protein [uncultured Desulfobulbus sp.]